MAPLRTAPGISRSARSKKRSRRPRTWRTCNSRCCSASSSATAIPTMPPGFSVPARRARSCPPPVCWARNGVPRRRKSAPTPFGPRNLCAEIESRSTPSAPTSSGSWPGACTASVCSGTSRPISAARSRSAAATAATGCTVPTSLLASITLTSTVRSSTAAATAAGSTRPSPSTPTRTMSKPKRSRNSSVCSTAWCSTAVETMRSPTPASCCAKATPFRARLIDSVPPLVKTTSPGRQPSTAATRSRASSMAACASRPRR